MDLNILTDAELDDLRIEVLTEQERRALIASAGPSVRDTIIRYMEVSGATKEDVMIIATEMLATIPDHV